MNQIIYISSSESKQIEVWRLENFGILNLIQIVALKGEPQPLCINKEKKILYVAIRPKFYIICYKINRFGFIKFYKKVRLSVSLNHITLDVNKQLIFCSSYHFNSLNIFKLDVFGIPIIDSLITLPNILGCHSSCLSMDYKKIFVTALKENKIYVYNTEIKKFKIKKLIKLKNSINFGPRHMCIHNNGKYLYNINELNGSVDVWYIEHFNNILKTQNISIFKNNINTKPWSADIIIHPSGKFLYSCDRKLHLITIFKILNNGKYLKIKKNFITEIQPRSFNINKKGNILIVAGEKSNTIACYSINFNTGYIKLISIGNTGKNPLWVLIHNI
ncbi:beta-propeller fold lactonase family protein [Buchnera aphidicola (Mollitrichosiphum nigrofasciatum)]|uniref:beta-propeller fold lactonase family protein n=1 Tax=Buchnera aphidicola TaxID=9 RepID=UPI0031B80DEA